MVYRIDKQKKLNIKYTRIAVASDNDDDNDKGKAEESSDDSKTTGILDPQ